MAVAYGGSATAANGNSTSPALASFTTSGSNLAVIVFLAVDHQSGAVVSSVSGFSVTGIKIIEAFNSNSLVSIWAIVAPSAGSSGVTAVLSTGATWQIAADWFTGADQTTPCPTGAGNVASTTGAGASSLSITLSNLASGEAGVGVGAQTVSGDVSSFGPNQTFLNDTTSINWEGGYRLGAGALTANWINNSGEPQIMAAARIVAAGGAPTNPAFVSIIRRAMLYLPRAVNPAGTSIFVPAQAAANTNQPVFVLHPTARAKYSAMLRRGTMADPPIPQQTAAAIPTVPPAPTLHRKAHGLLRRGRLALPPWGQAAPNTNQPVYTHRQRSKRLYAFVRRGRIVRYTGETQGTEPYRAPIRRRVYPSLLRRGLQTRVVPIPPALPNPAFVFKPTQKRPIQHLRRRGTLAFPVQKPPPLVLLGVYETGGNMLGARLRRGIGFPD